MILTFNALGVIISTDTTDEALRQGNVGNTLKAIFQGKNNLNYTANIAFTRSDGQHISGIQLTPDATDLTKFVYEFDDPWFFAKDGETTCTINLVNAAGTVVVTGQFTFDIEKTDFSDDDPEITVTQYNSIMSTLALKQNIQSGIVTIANKSDIVITEYADGQVFYVKNEQKLYYNNNGVLALYSNNIGIIETSGLYDGATLNKDYIALPVCYIIHTNTGMVYRKIKTTGSVAKFANEFDFIDGNNTQNDTLGRVTFDVNLSTGVISNSTIYSKRIYNKGQIDEQFYNKGQAEGKFVDFESDQEISGKKTFTNLEATLLKMLGYMDLNGNLIKSSEKSLFAIGSSNPTYYAVSKSEEGNTYTVATTTDVATAKQEAITTSNNYTVQKIEEAFINSAISGDLSVGGNATIAGNLTVGGIITSVDTQTISTAERFIQMMKGNSVAVSGYVGHVVPKYDGTHDFFFGISGNTYVIGDVTATFNENGDVTAISNVSLEPLATRADSNLLTDGNLVMWDATSLKLVDSSFNPVSIAEAEATRVSNEQARQLAEGTRQSNETTRGLNEVTRQSNETTRQDALKEMLRTHPNPISMVNYNHIVEDDYVCNWYYDDEDNEWSMTVDATADVNAFASFGYQSDVLYNLTDEYDMSSVVSDIQTLQTSLTFKQDKISGLTDNTGSLDYTGDVKVKTLTQTQANSVFNFTYGTNALGTINDVYSRGEVINNIIYLIGNFKLTIDTAGTLSDLATLTMTLPAVNASAVYDLNGDTVADPVTTPTIITSVPCVAVLDSNANQGASNYEDCYCEIYNDVTANVLKINVFLKSSKSVSVGDELSVMFRTPLTLI